MSNELSFITKFITFVGKHDIMLDRASHNIMFANSCNKFSNTTHYVEKRNGMFYLTTHATPFITVTWRRTHGKGPLR